jgi:lipopolysaccharide biosynthesis protein
MAGSLAVLRVREAHRHLGVVRWSAARLATIADEVLIVDERGALPADPAIVPSVAAARERARALAPSRLLLADDAWLGPFGEDVWPTGEAARLVADADSWTVLRDAALERWLDGGDPDAVGGAVVADPIEGLERGVAIVRRDLLLTDPLALDAEGLSTAVLARDMAAHGLPTDLVAASLAGSAPPRALQTALGLVSVLSDEPPSAAPTLRVLVVAHVFYPDMLDELLARADMLGPHRLVVTTWGDERGREIETRLAASGRAGEVRVVASNRGRDVAAFLIGCRDLLESGEHDVVMKLHSKRSPQVGGTAGRAFKRLLLDNLLASPAHGARLLRLFEDSPSLGMVVPPMVHSWYGTLGRAWYTNRKRAVEVAARAGITIPLDDDSPIAPYGSMFAARPEALAPLLRADLRWDEFPTEGEYIDGSLAHVVERLFAASAHEAGFAVRTVLSAAEAGRSHALLEHKLDVAEASLERVVARKIARVPWKARRIGNRLLGRPRD